MLLESVFSLYIFCFLRDLIVFSGVYKGQKLADFGSRLTQWQRLLSADYLFAGQGADDGYSFNASDSA